MAEYDRRLRIRDPDPATGKRPILWRGRPAGIVGNPLDVHNRFQGACFIVCSGPSLNEIDMARIARFPCLPVNGAIQRFADEGLSPAFYTAADADFFENRLPMVGTALASGATCFLSVFGIASILRKEPSWLRGQTVYLSETINRVYGQPRRPASEFDALAASDPVLFLTSRRPSENGVIGFSADLARGVFCGRTIAFQAIQIAYYLGFRQMFLVGMDLGGSGDAVRFYEERQGGRPSKLNEEYERFILPSFEVLRDSRAALALEVYNLSPASRLPPSVIPKISVDEALEMAAASRPADNQAA